MQKSKNSLKFNKKYSYFFILLACFLIIFPCFFSINAKAIPYIPASPSGPIYGCKNNDYEYTFPTNEQGSNWKFDWGDGNYSDWIQYYPSLDYVHGSHSWSKLGIYEVRIKYMSKYMEESKWSAPLIVSIVPAEDLEKEKDSEDDFLDLLNSISINIEGDIHYIFDDDADSVVDSFYNSQTNVTSDILLKSDGTCYIDFNGDLKWDYVYSFVDKSIKKYNVGSKSEGSSELSWLTAILSIILVVFVVILILFKMGVFYVYEEEYEIRE